MKAAKNRKANVRVSSLVLAACLAACGSHDDSSASTSAASSGDGVDDVKAACDARTKWSHLASSACTQCLFEATDTPCVCNPDQGKCWLQSLKVTSELDCTIAVKDCAKACASDCACVDACYAGHAACRAVASARDGCVAAACDSACR